MRAFGFLAPAILVIITLVYWPAGQNQTDTLPTSSDYQPAGASCKQKGKLAVFNVMGVWVDFGKSIKCQFTVTSCKGTKNFASLSILLLRRHLSPDRTTTVGLV